MSTICVMSINIPLVQFSLNFYHFFTPKLHLKEFSKHSNTTAFLKRFRFHSTPGRESSRIFRASKIFNDIQEPFRMEEIAASYTSLFRLSVTSETVQAKRGRGGGNFSNINFFFFCLQFERQFLCLSDVLGCVH